MPTLTAAPPAWQLSAAQVGPNGVIDHTASEQASDGSGGGLSDTDIAAIVATVCVLSIALVGAGYFLHQRNKAMKARANYKGVQLATHTHDVERTPRGTPREPPPPPPPPAPKGDGSTEWVAGSSGSRA